MINYNVSRGLLLFSMTFVALLAIVLAFVLAIPVGILFLLFCIADKLYKKLEAS